MIMVVLLHQLLQLLLDLFLWNNLVYHHHLLLFQMHLLVKIFPLKKKMMMVV
jgi:hypothetical protein